MGKKTHVGHTPKEIADLWVTNGQDVAEFSAFLVGIKVGGADGYNDHIVMPRTRKALARLLKEGRIQRHRNYKGWYTWSTDHERTDLR